MAGGIGLHIHNIRSEGSSIIGTNGKSNGIVPMFVFLIISMWVDQGEEKMEVLVQYLNHKYGDIESFMDLRKTRRRITST